MARRATDRQPALVRIDRPAEADANASTEPFVGLVSGADVPVLELDLPPALRGQARERVARRRLTDMIGPEGGQAELRPIQPAERGRPWRRALMADRDRLTDWRKALGDRGGRCLALLPDYMALPAAPDVWVLDIGETETTARLGPEDGFAAEHTLARRMLAAALNGGAPRAVLRTGAEPARHDDLFAGRPIALADDAAALQSAGAAVPAAFACNELRLDLARDIGAESARMRATVRTWRTAVALVALGVLLYAASLWSLADARRDLAAGYRAEADALTRAHFVPQGPIFDIRRQVAASLAERQGAAEADPGAADPLARLRSAAGVVSAAGAGLVSAGFQPETGWALEVETVDFSALDQIVADLRAAGLPVEVAEARAEDTGGVAGTLLIARGATR